MTTVARHVGIDHRDPLVRPFIEVEAKIVRDLFGDMKREKKPANEIVASLAQLVQEDAETSAKEMSDRLRGGTGTSGKTHLPIACTEGCAHCCYGVVYASTPELLRLGEHLRKTRTEGELAALKVRATKTADDVKQLHDVGARAKAKIPCPLLDVPSGRCTAYDVRPVACRAYHSGDAGACKKAFDEGDANPVLPIDPPLFNIAHAHAFGMMTALATEGLDVGPYDLAATLALALDGELADRWLAGETVLQHTRISEASARGYDAVLAELGKDLTDGRLDDAELMAHRLLGSFNEAKKQETTRQARNRRKRERKKR